MSRRRREGFDYFIDRYEDSYYDYDSPEFYDEPSILGSNRFDRRNRYTGQIIGKNQYVDTSSVYGAQQQGTMEFSALPGHGGLQPGSRPLGDQTMMISPTPQEQQPNPYVRELLEAQARKLEDQLHQIDKQGKDIESLNANLQQKMSNIEKVLDDMNKTQTLLLNIKEDLVNVETEIKKSKEDQIRRDELAQKQAAQVAQEAAQQAAQQVAQEAAQQAVVQPQSQPLPAATQQAPAPQVVVAPIPTPAQPPRTVIKQVQKPVPTTFVKKQPTKKKLSGGMIAGVVLGSLVAIGLIVFGVLLLVGVITF